MLNKLRKLAVEFGLPLRMVYRIKDLDAARGFRRYFWKATPVRGTGNVT